MLCQKRIPGVVAALLVAVAIFLLCSACTAIKGSIVIFENPNGNGFTMQFKEWSAQNKCELSLKRDDVLQVELSREAGEIALTISGKNGGEPYAGNDLPSGIFTVTVSEMDEYVIAISGKDATGSLTVKNLGGGID